jgi:phosphatidylglycerol:prolipoprotein diacylglycerol transferase
MSVAGFIPGACIGLLCGSAWLGIPWRRALDAMAWPTMIGLSIGRVGCWFSGCCYGRYTDLSLGARYSLSTPAGWASGMRPLHPAQLYEAGLDASIAIILVDLRRRRLAPGTTAAVYLLLYPTIRFVMEFFRGDVVVGSFGLTRMQWIMVVYELIVMGSLWAVIRSGVRSTANRVLSPPNQAMED